MEWSEKSGDWKLETESRRISEVRARRVCILLSEESVCI